MVLFASRVPSYRLVRAIPRAVPLAGATGASKMNPGINECSSSEGYSKCFDI